MRVSSVSLSYPLASKVQRAQEQCSVKNTPVQQSFEGGKNQYAKLGAGIFGGLGSLGAIGGLLIMTGGIALPVVLAYGGACALTGAALGHQVDKDSDGDSDNNKDND